ncbi:MAG: hypothetical protein ACI88G_000632, partial [Woeseiaceae bacterium]
MISLRARVMRFLLRKYFKPLSAQSDVYKVRAGFE